MVAADRTARVTVRLRADWCSPTEEIRGSCVLGCGRDYCALTLPVRMLARMRSYRVLAFFAVVVSTLSMVSAGQARHPAPTDTTARQAAPANDALWALAPSGTGISVCQNPTAAASIADCFGSSSLVSLPSAASVAVTPATDGTNAYFGSQPGYSCPIAQYGQSCTPIQIGWGSFYPTDVVAANGSVWMSEPRNGGIYQCPSDLPYTAASSMPAACAEFDDAGSSSVMSLAYANGQLYAGMSAGALLSCTASQAGSCVTLDSLGTSVNALAVGGGYLWAGLNNGKIMRCDPVIANACDLWDSAGKPIVSIADDGQGTLWAAVSGGMLTHPSDVIWSCPEATANACATVISNVHAWWVTAGAGNGFSTVSNGSAYPPIAWGSTQYPQSVALVGANAVSVASILYIPAGGAPGLGGAQVRLRVSKRALARTCAMRDTHPATVVVRGPHRVRVVRRLDLCEARYPARIAVRRHDLLYPGTYSVWVRSAVFSGTKRITVVKNRTARVTVGVRVKDVDGTYYPDWSG